MKMLTLFNLRYMNTRFLLSLCLSLLLFSCDNQEKDEFDLLISNAVIVDVSSGELVKNQLILISGDTIRKVVDQAEIDKYSAKNTIDAAGKFVMPGLWDMHVHFRGGDTLIQENKDFLPLFLAYGITTVRDAGGDITPSVLDWREQVKAGQLIGPRIFTPGPKLDGENPAWPGSIKVSSEEEIEAALDSLQSIGADFVKVYDGSLSKESFYAIIRAAEKRNLKTTGHMPLTADFIEAIDIGLDGAEHMYYPLKSTSPLADSLTELNKGYGMIETIIDTYDPKMAEEVFKKMSAEDVFITPTLHIQKTLSEILDVDHSQDTILPFIGKGIQQTYLGRIEGARRAKNSGSQMRQKMEKISAEMIVPMYENGVKILAGSDSGAFNSYVYPGESLHGELAELVKAGLTPQQALETSVINGPRFFDLQDYYGAVSAGKVADLIILNSNPLEDIKNVSKISSVIKGGKKIDPKDLKPASVESGK